MRGTDFPASDLNAVHIAGWLGPPTPTLSLFLLFQAFSRSRLYTLAPDARAKEDVQHYRDSQM